jgi:hypothetical protein
VPFFHDQDRSGLRRIYVEAWRKWRSQLPLEPLENQIVAVLELHPEYQRPLTDPDAALDRDYTPEQGQTNPFLHMGLHLAIREQVGTDRPAGIRGLYERLLQRLGDAHEVEHRMMERLAEAMWQAQRSGLPPDEAAYLEALRRLDGAR